MPYVSRIKLPGLRPECNLLKARLRSWDIRAVRRRPPQPLPGVLRCQGCSESRVALIPRWLRFEGCCGARPALIPKLL